MTTCRNEKLLIKAVLPDWGIRLTMKLVCLRPVRPDSYQDSGRV